VLPSTHTVELKLTLAGQTVTQGLNVNALTETVTYVQFTVRNGQLVPTTWTSRGTTPF
jgi:ABC-type sulfate transport system substrate-binding protein